jgi:SOS-response transcriptional repressor LexA
MEKDTKIGKRIADALQKKNGGNQSELARFVGVSPQAVQKWIAGETEPRGENLTSAAEFLGMHPAELRFGQMQSAGGEARSESNVEPGPDFKNNRRYPVISWVQAGEWATICDNFESGDAEDWRPCHRDLGPCGFILRVRGESMTAVGTQYTFPDGIMIYVSPDAEAIPGKFVIVRRDGGREATFKRLVMVEGDPYLEALNPNWPQRYLKMQPGDTICGVVMHAGFDVL